MAAISSIHQSFKKKERKDFGPKDCCQHQFHHHSTVISFSPQASSQQSLELVRSFGAEMTNRQIAAGLRPLQVLNDQ